MVRLVPVLLAVALLLSAPGVAALAGAPGASAGPAQDGGVVEQSRPENTTSLLLLDDVQASNLTQPEPNLATTLSMQGSELDGQFEGRVVQQRLSGLEDGETQMAFALDEVARLQTEVDDLLTAERRARQRYVAGELTPEAYLRTLARLDAKVRAIGLAVGHINRFYLSNARTPLQRELGLLRSELVILEGPVRERMTATVEGRSSGFPVFVGVSAEGVELSTIGGETYTREAYRSDHVVRSSTRLDLTAALDRLHGFYPWVTGPNDENLTGSSPLGLTAWNMGLRHDHGRLTTYFYGNATAPYREVQHKSLPNYPFESSEETFSNDLVLTVNRTYAGGPMEVTLTNETGTPLDGEVRIDGSAVGSTGDDGTLWVLQPEGSFTVMAVHEGERITLDLEQVTAEFVDEQ